MSTRTRLRELAAPTAARFLRVGLGSTDGVESSRAGRHHQVEFSVGILDLEPSIELPLAPHAAMSGMG